MKKQNSKEGSLIGNMNVTGGQVNIVGEGTMNQVYNFGSTSEANMENFIALLRQINELTGGSTLDSDTKSAIQRDLQVTIEQSQKPQPQKGLILNRLKGLLDLVISLGGAVSASQTIYPLLQRAMEFAQKLFIH